MITGFFNYAIVKIQPQPVQQLRQVYIAPLVTPESR
jgi:hypothetical protein